MILVDVSRHLLYIVPRLGCCKDLKLKLQKNSNMYDRKQIRMMMMNNARKKKQC